MSTTQADAGILIILYQSTDLRIYVIPKDYEFEKELADKVIDFNRRIDEKIITRHKLQMMLISNIQTQMMKLKY